MLDEQDREGETTTGEARIGGPGRGLPWRLLGWGGAALLLLVPLVGRWPWTGSDFAFAGVAIVAVGLALELVARKGSGLWYRLGAAAAVGAAFMIVWINVSVGMIGDNDNSYNLLWGGVLLLALGAAAVARFEAAGMARAMSLAALAHAAVAAGGYSANDRGALLSLAFAAPWLVSAMLFRRAARA